MGARGVLIAPVRIGELLTAARAVAAGGVYLARRAAQRVFSPGPTSAGREKAVALLTPRELEILSRQARGRPVKLIASDLGVSEHTVTNHLFSIHQKLNVHSAIETINVGFHTKLGGWD